MHDKYFLPESERRHFVHTALKPQNSHVGKSVPKVFEKKPTPEEIPKPPQPKVITLTKKDH